MLKYRPNPPVALTRDMRFDEKTKPGNGKKKGGAKAAKPAPHRQGKGKR